MIDIRFNVRNLSDLKADVAELSKILGLAAAVGEGPTYHEQPITPQATEDEEDKPKKVAQGNPAKVYTLEELSLAGADLMKDKGVEPLSQLVKSFGVESLVDLPSDKFNAFAEKLKEMGAKL